MNANLWGLSNLYNPWSEGTYLFPQTIYRKWWWRVHSPIDTTKFTSWILNLLDQTFLKFNFVSPKSSAELTHKKFFLPFILKHFFSLKHFFYVSDIFNHMSSDHFDTFLFVINLNNSKIMLSLVIFSLYLKAFCQDTFYSNLISSKINYH